jgi:hypothetical protein
MKEQKLDVLRGVMKDEVNLGQIRHQWRGLLQEV